MKKLILFLLFISAAQADDACIWLPNIPGCATGTQTGSSNAIDVTLVGGGITIGAVAQGTPGPINSPWPVLPTDGTNHASYTSGEAENVNIVNSIMTNNPSVGPIPSPVPSDATYMGAENGSGNLVGLKVGSQTTANSLACVLASDQVAIPATQSGTWTVEPGNVPNTNPWLTSISQGGNTAVVTAGDALKVDGSAVTQPISIATHVTVDQGIPGPLASPWPVVLPSGTALGTVNQGTPGPIASPWPVAIASNIPQAPNTNGSLVTNATITTSATTFSPPANAIGFILEAPSSNTVNLRWAIVTTPTTTTGMRLEPGRDSGFVPADANVLVISESSSAQEIDLTWVKSQ
jgi:hypothetical protein